MESQKINILLQKYFDAETTIGEENELITYFTSGEVDENLKMYVPMFSGMKELSAEEELGLGDDLMNYILESEHKEKILVPLDVADCDRSCGFCDSGDVGCKFLQQPKPMEGYVF